MTSAQTRDVAVVGSSSLVGEAVIEELKLRKFPYRHLYRIEELRDLGRGEEAEEPARTYDVEQFDFRRTALVFFCSRAALAQRFAAQAAEHAWVVDGSGAFRDRSDVPLAAADINAAALATGAGRGLVALPGSASLALATALAPLHAVCGLLRAEVVSYHCASGEGRSAVERLARDSAALLGGRPVKTPSGSARAAFNVIPQVGAISAEGEALEEIRMAGETQRLLGSASVAINVTAVRVPVFFGHSLAIHAAFERPIDRSEALQALAAGRGVHVVDPNTPPGYPTPADERLASDRVHVGRVRAGRTGPSSLNFWVVAENVRKCAAVNAVFVAQILVNDHC